MADLLAPSRPVTVVVCTRDRPSDMARCLRSLMRACPADVQIVIVDQSGGPDTAAVVGTEVGEEGREIDYVASTRVGLSVARNEGAAMARGETLLFTDDDCEVSPDWVRDWVDALEADPRVGIGFGRASTERFDRRLGFVAGFDPGPGQKSWGTELLRRGAGSMGMGANMAVRRAVWSAVGGFDELLGAGAPFPAAEEIDLAVRAVRAGYRIGQAQRPTVVHHGYRQGAAASRLAIGYSVGVGAMYAKHARVGDRAALGLLALELGRHVSRVLRAVVTGSRPLGAKRVPAMLSGAWRSMAYPVDANHRVYRKVSERTDWRRLHLEGIGAPRGTDSTLS